MEISNTEGESRIRPPETAPAEPENPPREPERGNSSAPPVPDQEILPTAPDYMGSNIDIQA